MEAKQGKTRARTTTSAWQRTLREYTFRGCLFASLLSWLTVLAQPSSPPSISDIPNLAIYPNLTVSGLVFTVSDADTPADSLTLTGATSNTNLVSPGNIMFGGSGSNRTLSINPTAGARGVTVITITVSDGSGGFASDSFELRVEEFTDVGTGFPPGAFGILAWGDFDNDNDLDLLLPTNPSGLDYRSYLNRNNGNVTFTALQIGLPGIAQGAVAWGDYNNDGYMDILITGSTQPGPPFLVSRIFRNNGNTNFTDINVGFAGLYESSATWVDFDNDGSLDVLLAGITSTFAPEAKVVSRLFRNNRNGTFSEVLSGLPGVSGGSVDWADYDNDGDMDVLLVGGVFRNDGFGKFTDIGANLPGAANLTAQWCDLDNDGRLDVLLAGDSVLQVYQNLGNDTFAGRDIGQPSAFDTSLSAGDFDNDGDLDILLSGFVDQVLFEPYARIFRNEGGLNFTGIDAGLAGIARGQISWVDCDADGDLDILLTGNGAARLYRNNLGSPNTPPSSPTNLSAAVLPGNNVLLNWSPSSDLETTNAGTLHYNIRVGTTPGGIEIMAAHADLTSGYRRLAGRGNSGQTNSWKLLDVPRGTYYWSVQAIDTAFAGSKFAAEATFSITNARPTISVIPNQEVFPNRISTPASFIIGDLETPAADLAVAGRSSDTNLVPDQNIVFGGNGSNRTVTITPATDRVGTVTITVTVTDGVGETRSTAFILSVVEFSKIDLGFAGLGSSFFALGDYDGDDDLDLITTGNSGPDHLPNPVTRLYRNEGNQIFTEIATSLPALVNGSIAWGDYDNDGRLDVALGGVVLRNNGSGNFADIGAGARVTINGSVSWADYDHDGWVDLLDAGQWYSSPGAYAVELYRNVGSKAFVTVLTGLPGIRDGLAVWGDYDNDGRLDILLSSRATFGLTGSAIYRNAGNGTFTDSGFPLPVLARSASAWFDFNNDGQLDFVLAGTTNGNASGALSLLFQNNGRGSFDQLFPGLPGIVDGSIACGDYDSDGYGDILLAGLSSTGRVCAVYRNNRDSTFSDIKAGFLNLADCKIAWGDLDKDGDLDILSTGVDENLARRVILYRNNSSRTNTPPGAPTNLTTTVTTNIQNDATFSWSPPQDLETTNSSGLTYNLRVGTSAGGRDIVSPNASLLTGRLTVPQRGFISTNQWTLSDLAGGTYYWAVQAVDPGISGSSFSQERSFTVPNRNPIMSNIANQGTLMNQALSNVNFSVWDRETPVPNLSFSASSSNPELVPQQNIKFTIAGTNVFITIIPATNQVGRATITITVADANGGSVTDFFLFGVQEFTPIVNSLLPALREGTVAWGDYDNDGYLDLLLTGNTGSSIISRVYRNNHDGTFADVGVTLVNVSIGSVAWGDYDNDGYLDILLTGSTSGSQFPNASVSKVYRNEGGNGRFTDLNLGLPGVYYSSAAWGDFDNDGRTDIVLSGASRRSPITRIYRNNGDGTFSDFVAGLPGVGAGSVAGGDFDNDGDLDLLVAGTTTGSPNGIGGDLCRLYRNDGHGVFTEVMAGLPQVRQNTAACGDFNNDGYLDILLVGPQSAVFQNNGNGTFTDIGAALPSLSQAAGAWGDYDNDGNIDILLSGWTGGPVISEVYRNNGDGSFSKVVIPNLVGARSGALAWGDYDGDGDLDALITGAPDLFARSATQLYRNNVQTANSPPSVPTGLSAVVAANDVILSWSPANDNETSPIAGLNYNLRIGTTLGGEQVLASQAALGTGYRRVPRLGNAGPGTTWTLRNQPPGNYFWSVQAIDTSFAGSAFSAGATFSISSHLPQIEKIPDQATKAGIPTSSISVLIRDVETLAENLVLRARSSNPVLVQESGIVFGGSGTNRTTVITPTTNQIGLATITISVYDLDGAYSSQSFLLTVGLDVFNLSVRRLSTNSVELSIKAEPNQSYVIELSEDLVAWTAHNTVSSSAAGQLFIPLTIAEQRQQFYRARRVQE